MLTIVFCLSLYTLRDSFSCSGSFEECNEIRSKISCKAHLVSPIMLHFPVESQLVSNAAVSVMCGWEPATSQIRVCIVLSSLYATYLAYQAASQENRKITDTYLQAVGFLSFLLATTSLFDVLSITDSQQDNFDTCSQTANSRIAQFTNSEHPPCSFLWFWLISGFTMLSALVVFSSYNVMLNFRKSIAIDGLWRDDVPDILRII